MTSEKLPPISILIPTLNAARVLGKCLESIAKQDYPKEKIEIIIADGGSTDDTLSIIRKFKVQNPKFKVRVVNNPLKTGEAGKAVALRYAQGELVALIDSDNFLPDKNWFKKMTAPFADPEIIGSEPWEFTYRKQDSLVNRYCALIGANDPYCYFVGNYDKKSVLSGKWTGLRVRSEKWEAGREVRSESKEWDYLKVKIPSGKILPTIGANGVVWRRRIFQVPLANSLTSQDAIRQPPRFSLARPPATSEVARQRPRLLRGECIVKNHLFDTDIPYALAKKESFWFAKVKAGIIHDYCRSISAFYRKQKRRAKDFFYLEGKKERTETFQRQTAKQLYFIFSVVLVFPLIIQSLKGYMKKPDIRVWLFHPLACLITLWVYGSETILAQFKKSEMSRKGWGQ